MKGDDSRDTCDSLLEATPHRYSAYKGFWTWRSMKKDEVRVGWKDEKQSSEETIFAVRWPAARDTKPEPWSLCAPISLSSRGRPTLSFKAAISGRCSRFYPLLNDSHIKSVTKSTFCYFKNISGHRPSLAGSIAETLMHAFNTSCLRYCNGVLFMVPSKTLDRLQYVQFSCQYSQQHKAEAPHHPHH